MNKWKYAQDFANEIAEIDKLTNLESDSGLKELNIAQCSHVVSKVKMLYREGGRYNVIGNLDLKIKHRTKKDHQSIGLTMEENKRACKIVSNLLFNKFHWFYFSRIRCNIRRVLK